MSGFVRENDSSSFSCLCAKNVNSDIYTGKTDGGNVASVNLMDDLKLNGRGAVFTANFFEGKFAVYLKKKLDSVE